MDDLAQLRKQEIPGRITITNGRGGLPKITLTTGISTAEVYLHGAHVTHFQKKDESPLLWMSAFSQFASGKAIRGGVPICFPWFGPREGLPAHGLARITTWELIETRANPDGSVVVRLRLPTSAVDAHSFRGNVEFVVTVGDTLTIELQVANTGGELLSFEECLHTYFTVGDISTASIAGLRGAEFLDKMDGGKRKRESDKTIRINAEVDRVYLDTEGSVEIHDATLRRVISVEKSGSTSTVVWNPWIAKSKAMPDFGDEEFKQMVCVEAGNVAQNKITLPPGKSSSLRVVLCTRLI